MNDDLKVDGWALNSEYFCAIMHELRGDMTYRSIVDEFIIVPDGADTRDTEAVKRISTAYLKLLFPHEIHVACPCCKNKRLFDADPDTEGIIKIKCPVC